MSSNKQQNIIEIIITAVDKAAPGLRAAAKDVADFTAKFPLLGGIATLAAMKVAGAVKHMGEAIKHAWEEQVKLGAEMAHFSIRTRMSVEQATQWKYAIEMVGGSIEGFERNLIKLGKAMRSAAGDSEGKAGKNFAELGINVRDANGKMKSMSAVLLEIAASLQYADENSKKFAAAQELTAKGVAPLMVLFREGPEAIKKWMSEADRVGATFGDDLAESALKTEQAGKRLSAAWAGLMRTITGSANSPAADFKDAFTDEISMWNMKIKLVKEYWNWALHGNASGKTEKQLADEEREKARIEAGRKAEEDALKKQEHDQKDMMDRLIAYAKSIGAEWSSPVLGDNFQLIDEPLEEEKLRESIIKALDKQKENRTEFQKKLREAITKDGVIQLRAKIGVDLTPKRLQQPDKTPWSHSMPWESAPRDPDREATDKAIRDKQRMEEEDQKMIDLLREEKDAADELNQSLKEGLTSAFSDMVSAMLTGKNAAKAFADTIKAVLIQAISQYIAKLIVVNILKKAAGLDLGGTPMAQGGTVKAMAYGGRVMAAANGMTITGGRPGMDSVLIAGMPGEEVVDRSTSIRLRRMLSAFENGAAVSPATMRVGGSRSNIAINFNVARPVSTLDELSYGRTAVKAAKKAQEARL